MQKQFDLFYLSDFYFITASSNFLQTKYYGLTCFQKFYDKLVMKKAFLVMTWQETCQWFLQTSPSLSSSVNHQHIDFQQQLLLKCVAGIIQDPCPWKKYFACSGTQKIIMCICQMLGSKCHTILASWNTLFYRMHYVDCYDALSTNLKVSDVNV